MKFKGCEGRSRGDKRLERGLGPTGRRMGFILVDHGHGAHGDDKDCGQGDSWQGSLGPAGASASWAAVGRLLGTWQSQGEVPGQNGRDVLQSPSLCHLLPTDRWICSPEMTKFSLSSSWLLGTLPTWLTRNIQQSLQRLTGLGGLWLDTVCPL